MTQKQADQKMIKTMTPQQAKASLFSAITIIRKTVSDVPEKKRKLASSYNPRGHMKCVNYLKGFLNIWEDRRGT